MESIALGFILPSVDAAIKLHNCLKVKLVLDFCVH